MKLTRLLLPALALALTLRADEGMWTFDNLPKAQLKSLHGFEADQAWLDHVRLSALHFGGGSGSFVSAEGLVITNHHVGRGWIQQVSGPGAKDYIKHGFLAKTRAEELKIPNMAIRTLMRMEDVTAKVNAAVTPGMTEEAAGKARQDAITALADSLEKESGLQVSPVSLYQGGEVWLYGYKVHRDVRLVMAPEGQIASFGGDPDNFTYPRHDLDFCLFRVYEDGQPYKPEHHLAWSQAGVKAGDLTFVVGHPGRTQRQITYAQMLYQRDVAYPLLIANLERQRADLYAYGKRSEEHMRQVRTRIYGLENSLKAINGYWSGLKDAAPMAEVKAAEDELKAKVLADPALKDLAGGSWDRIEASLGATKPLALEASLITPRYGTPLALAFNLLEGQGGSRPAPQPTELDRYVLAQNLGHLKEKLGAGHPFVKAMVGELTPEAAAARLLNTRLYDSEFVKKLSEGGAQALETCGDPVVALARTIQPMVKTLQQLQGRQQAVVAEHGTRVAKARFQVYGKAKYPDATGSLRLSFGTVEGHKALGTYLQPFTTFHGLFDRALAWGPEAHNGAWAIPARWQEKKASLKLETPFNFIHKVDIIGGNSGSPVVDRKGEFVGVIFDGNIHMLPGNFYYDGNWNRGVTLDARAILEALGTVYEAKHLVSELLAK